MVKITVECDGKVNHLEGDLAFGIIGCDEGCRMGCSSFLVGKGSIQTLPSMMAELAVSTINLMTEEKASDSRFIALVNLNHAMTQSIEKALKPHLAHLQEELDEVRSKVSGGHRDESV